MLSSFAVGQLSGKEHWQARLLRYLSGTRGVGLGATTEPLIGFTDADYAGDKDRPLRPIPTKVPNILQLQRLPRRACGS